MNMSLEGIRTSHRRGSLLIVVVGVTALLAVTSTAVLLRVQSDGRSNQIVVQDAQARLALTAALHFLNESSRLGWHRTEEAYGWVDIRDGEPGPRTKSVTSLPESSWPALGSTFRGDLFAWRRPPYAIEQDPAPAGVVYVPDRSEMVEFLGRDTAPDWAGMDDIWEEATREVRTNFLMTPNPAVDTWEEFRDGDTVPRGESLGRGWFRIYRETSAESEDDGFLKGSTFVITVGAGGTRGFRDFTEDGASSYFPSAAVFNALRRSERRMWYRVQWMPQVGGTLDAGWRHLPWPASGDTVGRRWGRGGGSSGWLSAQPGDRRDMLAIGDQWMTNLMTNQDPGSGYSDMRTGQHGSNDRLLEPDYHINVQQGGSIVWIQRLEREPDKW